MKTATFLNTKCNVVFHDYAHGGKAIQLYDMFDGEPIATATINVAGISLADDEVVIKTYSENDGILEALIEAGIIEPTGRTIELNFCTVPICRVLQ